MSAASGSSAADYANDAAEAIRGLNRATIHSFGYRQPSDVDRTLTELSTLVQRLPQAIAQAAGWLDDAHASGLVGHDALTDPAQAVELTTALLAQAGVTAGHLARILSAAREQTSHLTGLGDTEGPVPLNGGTR